MLPRISATPKSAYASPPIRASTRWARAWRPFPTSQRGLSGTKNALTKKITEGTATAVNIHRQPNWPFHESRIIWSVADSGTGCAISQLTICAPKIPTTMVN